MYIQGRPLVADPFDPSALEDALEEAVAEGRRHIGRGRVATYIPQLARANPLDLGACIASPFGLAAAGDWDRSFTLQSVSKVFSLLVALETLGPGPVFSRVGMEPTGDAFNSILKLELLEPAKPLNPMINAGALAVSSLLVEELGEAAFPLLLGRVREAASNYLIGVDEETFAGERATGNRNRALAYFLKDVGAIRTEVEWALDFYFRQCSIRVSCVDLASMALFLACGGSVGAARPVDPEHARIVNAFLVTCGMYNASGEFAVRAGIGAKSGVSGAILAVVPGRLGIGCFGPALEERGNSVGGVELLVTLSRRLGLSIF